MNKQSTGGEEVTMQPVTDEFVHFTPITRRAQDSVWKLVPPHTEEQPTGDVYELVEYWRIMWD